MVVRRKITLPATQPWDWREWVARVQMTHSWRTLEEWWEVGVGCLEITGLW